MGRSTLVNIGKPKQGDVGTKDIKAPVRLDEFDAERKKEGGPGASGALLEKLTRLKVPEKEAKKRKKEMAKPIAFKLPTVQES